MTTPAATLAGRSAVVTGAGAGLGRAIARGLVGSGARVLLVGRSRERLDATAAELRCVGDVGVAACDISNPESVSALGEQLADEAISILVNNAGVPGPVKALIDIEPSEWDQVFDINVRGTYLMCRQFLPAMIAAGRGDIVNLASVSGKRPLAARSPYCASKMAVIGLTATLATEVGPSGVRVNSLSPGPVRGPRMEHVLRLESERSGVAYSEIETAFVARSAARRMLDEQEVADAVVAMLHMTGLYGADIDLSAGMIAR